MNKNMILAGVAAIGLYLFLQAKKIPFITVRQRTAQKIAQRIAQKVAPKRIGQPTTRAAYIAARIAAAQKKAVLRKAAAQKIGKKVGKKVAQTIALKIKAIRAAKARFAKRLRPQIQRPNSSKKRAASKLFPGAEKSRIIPYSESSRHSYYGPKSRKLQNEGYRVEMNKRQANSIEAYDDRILMDVLQHPWLHRKK